MTAHHYASASGIIPARNVRIATLDTGGASPISMILHAKRLVERGECSAVAVVASDAISSMPSAEFLQAADSAVVTPPGSTHPPCEAMPSPRIPHGYSRYTDAHMRSAPLTREQLAMVSVLMSHQGAKHPGALSKGTLSLESVLGAPAVAPFIGQFECARRADGAAAVIVARGDGGAAQGGGVRVAGGGEAAGSSHPPRDDADAMLCMEGAGDAFRQAYADAGWVPENFLCLPVNMCALCLFACLIVIFRAYLCLRVRMLICACVCPCVYAKV
jgi:acetyl-CoA acetyltransferase